MILGTLLLGARLLAADFSSATTLAPIADSVQAGRELAEKIRSTPPPENSQVKGLLRILAREAEPQTIPLVCHILLGQAGGALTNWEAIYRTSATDRWPEEILVVRFQAGRANEYFHARGAAVAQAPNDTSRVHGDQLETPLAGSDFWLCDLGLEFLHWPTQRVIKAEMRRSRPCRVLESVNPHPSPAGYARVLSWVDTEEGGILQAEAYDSRNKLLKEFSLGAFKKVEGEWQLKDMKIRNVPTGSRTWLEFDLKKP